MSPALFTPEKKCYTVLVLRIFSTGVIRHVGVSIQEALRPSHLETIGERGGADGILYENQVHEREAARRNTTLPGHRSVR